MQHETFLVYISFQGQIILQLAKVFGAFLSSHQMLGTFTASAGLFFMAEALQLGIHVAHAGLMPSGDVVNAYPFFVVGVLHLISSAVLGFGGLYHAALGPEILTSEFFAVATAVMVFCVAILAGCKLFLLFLCQELKLGYISFQGLF